MINLWHDLGALSPEAQGQVVAIGNFDGVHLGHQAVLTVAQRQAREFGVGVGVLSFYPSPRRFFNPDAKPSQLTPMHARARFFTQLNVKHLYVQKFDQAFSQMLDADFIEKILHKQLQVKHIVVGENFHFGYQRKGDVNFLVEQSAKYNFGVTPVSSARMTNGTAYSSSRVRELLQNGDPEGARNILGRAFEIEATVEHGQGQARAWGYPTANMKMGDYIRPKYGVYAVKVGLMKDGVTQWYPGVANLGVRPTFRGGDELLEAHLFDFDQDLYNRELRVQLWHYLRPEKQFGKADALREQIAKDAENAREKLGVA
jgi:riboflavin kinase/FMN adenylyltransferase